MKDWLNLLSRIFLSVIFFFESYDTLFYKTATFKSMAAYQLKIEHDIVYFSAVALLLLGAILLLFGYRVGLAAFLLLIYLVPYTFIVHDFWNQPTEVGYREQAIHFMKNLGIMGGLLAVWAGYSGRFGVKRILASTRS